MNIHPDFEDLLRLLDDFIRNKRATPRAKDKGDIEELTQQNEDATDG
jgi:hypothetical protein